MNSWMCVLFCFYLISVQLGEMVPLLQYILINILSTLWETIHSTSLLEYHFVSRSVHLFYRLILCYKVGKINSSSCEYLPLLYPLYFILYSYWWNIMTFGYCSPPQQNESSRAANESCSVFWLLCFHIYNPSHSSSTTLANLQHPVKQEVFYMFSFSHAFTDPLLSL